jgi:hypothetical protein
MLAGTKEGPLTGTERRVRAWSHSAEFTNPCSSMTTLCAIHLTGNSPNHRLQAAAYKLSHGNGARSLQGYSYTVGRYLNRDVRQKKTDY